MVHISLQSQINFGYRKNYFWTSTNLYRVVVNGEDGEYYEYEVEAESFSDESLAAGVVDVQFIEVYQIA